MEKSLKEKIKYNLKEMWEDEPYREPYEDISFKEVFSVKKGFESVINFARFELFYPKTREEYDFGGMTGINPKGWIPAIITNTAFAASIGNTPEDSLTYGGLACAFTMFFQPVLGIGMKECVKHISEKYKERKK